MPTPIRTQVLDKIEELLGEISKLKAVKRWQSVPIDLEVVGTPALVYQVGPERREKRNRLMYGTFSLGLYVYLKLNQTGRMRQAFDAQSDNLQALIHNQLMGSPGLRGLAQKVIEVTMDRRLSNDLFGEMVLTYEITYGHAFGDGFTTAY